MLSKFRYVALWMEGRCGFDIISDFFHSWLLQSKYDLLKEGQAKAVMNEKAIMAKLRHPFIINLAGTYQDADFLYMLLGIVQGGELFSLMHTPTRDGVPEAQAKFYGACIAEGLAFMHRRGFVYRDLKVRRWDCV